MPNDKYPIEDLKKWQDSVIEIAKKNLRRDGELRPVAFFMTEKMNLDESLINIAKVVEAGENKEPVSLASKDVHPSDTVIIILDLQLGPEGALSVIKQTMPAEKAAILTVIEAQGHRFGATNPAETIVNAVMKAMNIDYKDVVAKAVELIIRKTEAIAYIKLDETWMLDANNPEAIAKYEKTKGSLEHNPDALESITAFMETEGLIRMISVPFRRNRPKTGRIIGFGDPKELIETAESESKLSGRFTHLFDKAKSQPKPPVSPHAN